MNQRRVVLVVPGLIGEEGLLRSQKDALSRLIVEGSVFRIAAQEGPTFDESALLGVRPGVIDIAQGPLTLSALRSEPPDRSVHFHLSLASLDELSVIRKPDDIPNAAELKEILLLAERLNTRQLTVVGGEGLDHGLVWEDGSIELGTTSIDAAANRSFAEVLPQGDGEGILRRLIDDSVNLLADTDFNKARQDEGRPELNLLWPWGQGFPTQLPNLAFRRGEVVQYESRSLRLDGLVRLVGYRHGSRADFGRRLQTDWKRLSEIKSTLVVFAENIAAATVANRWDEGEEMLGQMVKEFVVPVTDHKPVRLSVIAPGNESSEGLGLRYDSEDPKTNTVPFDERVLGDRQFPQFPLWECVANALRP